MKKIIFSGLAFLLLCPVMSNAANTEKIKIAVASDDKTAKGSVSNKAAKCPYYLMFDSKGEMTGVIDNPYCDASRGAGPSTANFLDLQGVTLVIAGDFGSKMINTLKNKGITHVEFKGRVDDAVKRVLNKP